MGVREKMKTTKINAEISISRNYNKVTLGISDEPIEYESDDELQVKIRMIFALLKEEVEIQLTGIKK